MKWGSLSDYIVMFVTADLPLCHLTQRPRLSDYNKLMPCRLNPFSTYKDNELFDYSDKVNLIFFYWKLITENVNRRRNVAT